MNKYLVQVLIVSSVNDGCSFAVETHAQWSVLVCAMKVF